MNTEKNALRQYIRQEKTRHQSEIPVISAQVIRKLEADEDYLRAKTVLLYHSLPDEVDTHALIEHWYRKKQILLPVVKGEDLELRVYQGELTEGAFGIQEPTGDMFTDYSQIDFVLVPGVAFDKEGHRLGRGRGYYDRLLPLLPQAKKVGICFPFQLVEEVPTEQQDVVMDKIITL